MEDKEGMKKAVAGVMTEGAGGRQEAGNRFESSPPLSNRGVRKPKRRAGFRKSSNVTKRT